MYLLLSGEGKTDMGVCYPAQAQCDGEQFKAGAMAVIVDQLVELSQGYKFSHLEAGLVGFVAEAGLVAQKSKPRKKAMRLRGERRPPETQYYFENARRLAILAKEKSDELGDTVLAVLFRDADGTASADRGNWQTKVESMHSGFAAENYVLGVPMIPKPKSEAWLLCAAKEKPYQSCAALENELGNKKSKNPLKEQLKKALNGCGSVEEINQMLLDKVIDVEQIDMPAFNRFKQDLNCAVQRANIKK